MLFLYSKNSRSRKLPFLLIKPSYRKGSTHCWPGVPTSRAEIIIDFKNHSTAYLVILLLGPGHLLDGHLDIPVLPDLDAALVHVGEAHHGPSVPQPQLPAGLHELGRPVKVGVVYSLKPFQNLNPYTTSILNSKFLHHYMNNPLGPINCKVDLDCFLFFQTNTTSSCLVA